MSSKIYILSHCQQMKIFIGRGINDTNLIQLNILSLYTYAYLYKCTENLRLYSPDYLRVSKEFD